MKEQQRAPTVPEGSASHVTLSYARRSIRMYSLSEEELDDLAHGYNSVNQMFLGMVVGLLAAFGITLFTVRLDDRLFAIFVSMCFGSLVLSIFLGARVAAERHKVAQRIGQIKIGRG